MQRTNAVRASTAPINAKCPASTQLAKDVGVDFVVDDMRVAMEAKAAAKVTADHD
jgi:hypothetical protein